MLIDFKYKMSLYVCALFLLLINEWKEFCGKTWQEKLTTINIFANTIIIVSKSYLQWLSLFTTSFSSSLVLFFLSLLDMKILAQHSRSLMERNELSIVPLSFSNISSPRIIRTNVFAKYPYFDQNCWHLTSFFLRCGGR